MVLTCKQGYIEAFALLYRNIGFEFGNLSAMNELLEQIGHNGRTYVEDLSEFRHNYNKDFDTLNPLIYSCPALTHVHILTQSERYDDWIQRGRLHPVCDVRGVTLSVSRSKGKLRYIAI